MDGPERVQKGLRLSCTACSGRSFIRLCTCTECFSTMTLPEVITATPHLSRPRLQIMVQQTSLQKALRQQSRRGHPQMPHRRSQRSPLC